MWRLCYVLSVCCTHESVAGSTRACPRGTAGPGGLGLKDTPGFSALQASSWASVSPSAKWESRERLGCQESAWWVLPCLLSQPRLAPPGLENVEVLTAPPVG